MTQIVPRHPRRSRNTVWIRTHRQTDGHFTALAKPLYAIYYMYLELLAKNVLQRAHSSSCTITKTNEGMLHTPYNTPYKYMCSQNTYRLSCKIGIQLPTETLIAPTIITSSRVIPPAPIFHRRSGPRHSLDMRSCQKVSFGEPGCHSRDMRSVPKIERTRPHFY